MALPEYPRAGRDGLGGRLPPALPAGQCVERTVCRPVGRVRDSIVRLTGATIQWPTAVARIGLHMQLARKE
jgi:hypothetical protein